MGMVETLFVQLGDAMVNVSKVRAIKPTPSLNASCFIFFDGPPDTHNPLIVDVPMEHVQKCLAETYQQMAMMQAAANRAYGAKGAS